jgi:hypothetical protein
MREAAHTPASKPIPSFLPIALARQSFHVS